MSFITGNKIKISIFGQSHSEYIGVTLDGLPVGESIDLDALNAFTERRRAGGGAYSTQRKEDDAVQVICGLVNNRTCGSPLTAIIKNKDADSSAYEYLKTTPRPSHADFAAGVKYNGFNDIRGGGHFSGRLTAPLCIAGGICVQILQRKGVEISAFIKAIGDIEYSENNKKLIDKLFESLRAEGDSVGGIIECNISGLPAGVGEPMFDSFEGVLAKTLFAIPAVKGVEFGAGFNISKMKGSSANDVFCFENGKIVTKTNNNGGINGGLTNGMPVNFRVAFKPVPSIAREQDTVDLKNKTNTKIKIGGRHDVCIVPRAVVCVEAAAAAVVLDLMS